jgi:hypothetical protein
MKAAHLPTACVCVLSALCVLGWSVRARAQEYLMGADMGISSGIEGGGQPPQTRLTRTRLRLGADLRVDEDPEDILEFGALAELAPAGFGADIRYAHTAGDHFVFDAGVLAILAPHSLYGVGAGITYRLPLSKGMQFTVGPEADFFFLGTDLPDGVVIWQLRVQGGLRVDL